MCQKFNIADIIFVRLHQFHPIYTGLKEQSKEEKWVLEPMQVPILAWATFPACRCRPSWSQPQEEDLEIFKGIIPKYNNPPRPKLQSKELFYQRVYR